MIAMRTLVKAAVLAACSLMLFGSYYLLGVGNGEMTVTAEGVLARVAGICPCSMVFGLDSSCQMPVEIYRAPSDLTSYVGRRVRLSGQFVPCLDPTEVYCPLIACKEIEDSGETPLPENGRPCMVVETIEEIAECSDSIN